jgi:hypothetical protein
MKEGPEKKPQPVRFVVVKKDVYVAVAMLRAFTNLIGPQFNGVAISPLGLKTAEVQRYPGVPESEMTPDVLPLLSDCDVLLIGHRMWGGVDGRRLIRTWSQQVDLSRTLIVGIGSVDDQQDYVNVIIEFMLKGINTEAWENIQQALATLRGQ